MFFKIAELQLSPDRQGFIQFGKTRTHSLGASVVHIPDGRMNVLVEKKSASGDTQNVYFRRNLEINFPQNYITF